MEKSAEKHGNNIKLNAAIKDEITKLISGVRLGNCKKHNSQNTGSLIIFSAIFG